MKTIAIIPARGGSKRLPQKNIKLVGGIPLLAHSIIYAKVNSDIIDEIYVSTDDQDIKKIALEYGAKVIDRPADLSGDHEPTVSALKHVLQNIDDEVENVVLLQPTNPIRPESLLKETFHVYQSENYDSLFTVSRNYKKFGKITDQKFIPYNYKIGQRSQDMEPLYFENGLLYIAKAALILDDIVISENAFPFKIDHIFASVDIDTQEDFDYAKFLYHKHIKP
nr:acylneuraminate cytidylyltransferase family protein [Flavobacterium sp. ASV13]